MKRISHPVLNSRKVTVELATSVVLPDHVEKLGVVLTGPHGAVPPSMDMSDIEDRDSPFNVIANFQNLFDSAPKLLPTRCLYPD